jgi:hypothetical protein
MKCPGTQKMSLNSNNSPELKNCPGTQNRSLNSKNVLEIRKGP